MSYYECMYEIRGQLLFSHVNTLPVSVIDLLHFITFLSHLFPFAVWSWYIFVVQFPARGSTQVLLCLFPYVLWLWHFLYSVGPHPMSGLHKYTFVASRVFIAVAASQAGDAGSSRAPGLISGFRGPWVSNRGAIFLVPQWQCISSFVFYIACTPYI